MNLLPSVRHSSTLLLALLLLGGLAACTGTSAPATLPPFDTPVPSPEQPQQQAADPPETQPESGQDVVQPGTVMVVFAAGSLTNAFDEIADAFEARNPGLDVILNYANSAQLATQLAQGAEADVFASANERQMGVAVEAGRIDGPTVTFVTNYPTIIVPADNPAGITSIADLARPGVRLILQVPGGPMRDYADLIFLSLADDPAYGEDYLNAVYNNLVSEEDTVRRIAAKVALGEADAGLVFRSDITPDIADAVRQIPIPDEHNVMATYPIGLVAEAPQPELGRAFIEFVLSDEGQAILSKWGFEPAAGD